MSRTAEEMILAAIGEIDEELLLEAEELRKGAERSKSPEPAEKEEKVISFDRRGNRRRTASRIAPVLLSAAACVLIVFALGRAGIVPGILGRNTSTQSAAPAAAPAAASDMQDAGDSSSAYKEAAEETEPAEAAPAEEAVQEAEEVMEEPAAAPSAGTASETAAAGAAESFMADEAPEAEEAYPEMMAAAEEAPAPMAAPAASQMSAAPAAADAANMADAEPAAEKVQAEKAAETGRRSDGDRRILTIDGAEAAYTEQTEYGGTEENLEEFCGEPVLTSGDEQWFRMEGRNDNEVLILMIQNEQGEAVYSLWKRIPE